MKNKNPKVLGRCGKRYVSVSGCGHAGIVNTLHSVKSKTHDGNIYAVVGSVGDSFDMKLGITVSSIAISQ